MTLKVHYLKPGGYERLCGQSGAGKDDGTGSGVRDKTMVDCRRCKRILNPKPKKQVKKHGHKP